MIHDEFAGEHQGSQFTESVSVSNECAMVEHNKINGLLRVLDGGRAASTPGSYPI